MIPRVSTKLILDDNISLAGTDTFFFLTESHQGLLLAASEPQKKGQNSKFCCCLGYPFKGLGNDIEMEYNNSLHLLSTSTYEVLF